MIKRDRPAKQIIGYVRASTRQQGERGLGLAAQHQALAEFAARERFEIVETFEEIISGKGDDMAIHLRSASGTVL